MRRKHEPFEGFIGGPEMVFGWSWEQPDPSLANSARFPSRPLGAKDDYFSWPYIICSSAPQRVASVYGRERGGVRFNSNQTAVNGAIAAASFTAGSSSIFFGTQGWSAAVLYDVSYVSPATTNQNMTLLELSTAASGSGASACAFGLDLNLQSRQFTLRWTDLNNVRRSHTSPASLPASGMIGLDGLNLPQVDWYHNGQYLSSSSANFLLRRLGAASTASATRWNVGRSLELAVSSSTNAQGYTGALGNGAVWGFQQGRAGHRVQYAAHRRPWDEAVLLANDAYRVVDRVVMLDRRHEFGLLSKEIDLTTYGGQTWVVETERTTSVDEPLTKAKVVLRRRLGPKADLSPFNTETELVETWSAPSGNDITQLLDLHVRLRIDRAIVPTDHVIQGWEWEPRFEGFVDSFDVSENEVELSLVDEGHALNAAFIMDARAYNYSSPNKAIEDVVQQIVTDFEPALQDRRVPVGYLGRIAGERPTVYTEAGTSATPTLDKIGSVFRYNDVAAGPVFSAMQAVVDQIGAATAYKYSEERSDHLLTTYLPRRSKHLPLLTYSRDVDNARAVRVKVREPHGLAIGAAIAVTGTASRNFTGTVASVVGPREFCVAYTGASIPTGTQSGGTCAFTFSTPIVLDDVLDIQNMSLDIGSLRNHAVVKYQRQSTPDRSAPVAQIDVDGVTGKFVLQFSRSLPRFDPDNSGITFTLEGATSSASIWNGTYSGTQTGATSIASDIPYAGSLSSTLWTANLPSFKSDYYRYKAAYSTASVSVDRYGVLPVGVYEGTNLAINTDAEAQRLADNLISDMGTPTIDFAVQTKYQPYELHDVLRFPTDPKGRWTGNLDASIVAITERCGSGRCTQDLGLRAAQPTRGTSWVARVALGPNQPAPIDNFPAEMDNDLIDSWNHSGAVSRIRSIVFDRRDIERKEMGRRRDSTWVWVGQTPDFVPTPDKLSNKFRADSFEITQLGDGSALTPGTTYYVKFAEQDIWGNLGQINGLGLASAATVPGYVPRFLAETAAAVSVTSVGATPASLYVSGSSAWQGVRWTGVTSGDAAGIAYDTFGNVTTASGLSLVGEVFRVPADGVYAVSHHSEWLGDPLKITTGTWVVWGRIVRLRPALSGALSIVSEQGPNAVVGSATSTPFGLDLSAQVTCFSGDRLAVQVRSGSQLDALPYWESTSSTHFGYNSYAMVSQR